MKPGDVGALDFGGGMRFLYLLLGTPRDDGGGSSGRWAALRLEDLGVSYRAGEAVEITLWGPDDWRPL